MWKEKMTGQDLDAYTKRLIQQVEAEGLLPAPVHMKREILERSSSLDYQLRVQTRQIPKKLQFFCYSLKVGAAVVMALFLVTAYIHEVLHGVGWCLGTKKKWKSIYIGMMWSSLTPYCHCKEPLEPGKYLIGCLLPGTLLGLGIYLAAFLTGSNVLLWLSLLNVLGAGGDLLIAWYARRYRTGYVLDHPTECGFLIFQK